MPTEGGRVVREGNTGLQVSILQSLQICDEFHFECQILREDMADLKAAEDNSTGMSPKLAEVPVEVFREDSAYQTQQQRRDVIKALVDYEGATGDTVFQHGGLRAYTMSICSRQVFLHLLLEIVTGYTAGLAFLQLLAEEPTSINSILRKGWLHGEGGSTFDAWLTSSCAQAGPLPAT